MIPEQGRFIIRVDDEEWPSPSFCWYMLKCIPDQPQNEESMDQQGTLRSGWLPENYRTTLNNSLPKFLPELIPNLIPWMYRWRKGVQAVTITACCLVAREWNIIFTPVLYEDIFLGTNNPGLTQLLLHRTFRRIQPAHKALVRTMTITPAGDGSTANLLSICFSMRNLRRLILDFKRFNLSTLHPNFAQQLRSLSKYCTILMEDVEVDWESLPSYINFTRRSKSISDIFWVDSSHGE